MPYPVRPSTFLLRVYLPGEHDHLVAFRPVARDEGSCTLLWRILETWPVPGRKRDPSQRHYEHTEVIEGPRWFAKMELPELLDLLEAMRDQAGPRLFDVPGRVQDRYRSVLGESKGTAPQAGCARILYRGRWDPLVDDWGGGAYYSFMTRSNAFGNESELSLDWAPHGKAYSSRGDAGLLLDLGSIPVHHLASIVRGERPKGLSSKEEDAWELLWNLRWSAPEGERPSLSDGDAQRASEIGLGQSALAIVGHSYLLRSLLTGSRSYNDHLVLFTAAESDDYGHTLAWWVVRSWPAAQAEGR